MPDIQLPRLITVCLFVLAFVSVICSTLLKFYHVDSQAIDAIAIGSGGALAGFLARGSIQDK